MSLTGQIEAAEILARLVPLCGGRVYEGLPDDAATPLNADSTVKPFIAVSFGEPIPTARGRGLGVTEGGQPHVFPIMVTSVAASEGGVRAIAAEVNRLLIGWTPAGANASELRGRGGHKFSTIATETKPSRRYRIRNLETTINLVLGKEIAPTDVIYVDESTDPALATHISDPNPHPTYDETPDLALLFENGLI